MFPFSTTYIIVLISRTSPTSATHQQSRGISLSPQRPYHPCNPHHNPPLSNPLTPLPIKPRLSPLNANTFPTRPCAEVCGVLGWVTKDPVFHLSAPVLRPLIECASGFWLVGYLFPRLLVEMERKNDGGQDEEPKNLSQLRDLNSSHLYSRGCGDDHYRARVTPSGRTASLNEHRRQARRGGVSHEVVERAQVVTD